MDSMKRPLFSSIASRLVILSLALAPALCVSACAGAGSAGQEEDAGSEPPVAVTRHYAFIADSLEDYQWRRLYETVSQEGLKQGAYVEAMNDDLPDDYSKAELLKIAIAARVDGIFLQGGAEEEIVELINEATAGGIPVITLLFDAEGSGRICHIESGNYNLGRAYGRQIVKAVKAAGMSGSQDVLVIVDDAINRGSRSSAISAMLETVAAEGAGVTLNVMTEIAEEGVFTSAQAVRRRILSVDRVPDFIILFSEQDTLNAYQVLVDYNRLGDVIMIGCSSSDSILSAVARGAVHSVIITETEALSRDAIEAMNTYLDTGHVSEYIAADTIVIDKEIAERMTESETAQ